jgi:hypothetical protein
MSGGRSVLKKPCDENRRCQACVPLQAGDRAPPRDPARGGARVLPRSRTDGIMATPSVARKQHLVGYRAAPGVARTLLFMVCRGPMSGPDIREAEEPGGQQRTRA